jgi:SOS-response transcriptional repressor LexA
LINFYGLPEEEFNLANALGPKGLADQRARNVVGQRMADLRKDNKMSPAFIALQLHEYYALDVTESDLARYENGTTELDSDFLEKFANLFGLTLENLLEEDNLRMIDSPVGIAVKGFIDAGAESPEDEPMGLVASLQGRAPGVFEMEAAGPGLEAEGIKGGDRVFIDPDANLAIGKLFAIKAYDRVTIRKLDIDNDGEVIVAPSEAAQIGIKLGDPSIELLGRVVGIFHLL